RRDVDTVATTGQGIDALRAAIRARFGFERFENDRPMGWTQRHRDIFDIARRDPNALREMLA
ncbi:MAG: hypothetical protein ABIP55_02345, partial [Tepidisphaeraceae bacterium]